jgi:predicted metal-binding membrane protein
MSVAAQSRGILDRGPARLPGGLRGGQLVVLLALLALAALAWLITDLRMSGMDAGPGTDPGAFGFYVVTWVVMMTAMMFPSIAPMVLTYRVIQRSRQTRAASAAGPAATGTSLAVFVAGYLLVWTASGLLAYAAFKGARALHPSWLAWHQGGRWLVAGLLAAAAVYEITPWKHACLTRCRSPLGFLVGRWRDGRGGALRMGVEHGAWCLGCCWLLMVGLFALGIMSLTWMIVITVLIGAEKLAPRRLPGIGFVAAVLAALAIGVAVAPGDVPGLTIPSAHSMPMNSGMASGSSMNSGMASGSSMNSGMASGSSMR